MNKVIPVAWIQATAYYESDIPYLSNVERFTDELIQWTPYGINLLVSRAMAATK